MRYFFVLFGFAALAMICAMQRIAIYNLQKENTKIRSVSVAEFFRELREYDAFTGRNVTYVNAVEQTHSLPEPDATAESADVKQRIDMLVEHLRLESGTLPSLEWTSSVLIAARQKIAFLEYSEHYNKTHGYMLGTCTR